MDDGVPIAATGVPGYRVEALIGRGGMGEVYRAIDERLGRPVALKVLSDGLASDERYRSRLPEESRPAGGLRPPERGARLRSGRGARAPVPRHALCDRHGSQGPA